MPQWGTSNETHHGILVAGLPLFMEFEANETIHPGMVVEMQAEGTIDACDAGDNPVGVADIAMATQDGNGSRRFATCDTYTSESNPYVAGDQVKVISGPIIVNLILDDNEIITVGEKLACGDTAGYVHDIVCGTTTDPCAIVAEALETVTTGPGECIYIMAKLLM